MNIKESRTKSYAINPRWRLGFSDVQLGLSKNLNKDLCDLNFRTIIYTLFSESKQGSTINKLNVFEMSQQIDHSLCTLPHNKWCRYFHMGCKGVKIKTNTLKTFLKRTVHFFLIYGFYLFCVFFYLRKCFLIMSINVDFIYSFFLVLSLKFNYDFVNNICKNEKNRNNDLESTI